LIPGSVLLGFANGDHWAVVLPLQEKWPYWGGNSAGTRYPRDQLGNAPHPDFWTERGQQRLQWACSQKRKPTAKAGPPKLKFWSSLPSSIS
jgi:hypothetical protein